MSISNQAVTSTITPETLPVITWNKQAVITTESLAAVYGAEVTQIRNNFSRNKDRFIEGVHYFKLTSDDVKSFRSAYLLDTRIEVHEKANNLTLWTERGTIRHAKILETDQAWKVQEKLEDCYFAKATKKPVVNPMNRINANAKQYLPITDFQVSSFKEVLKNFDNKKAASEKLNADSLLEIVLKEVRASSIEDMNVEQYEKGLDFIAHLFSRVLIGTMPVWDAGYRDSTDTKVTMPVNNGQVTINSVPNVRYLVETDEHGNASIKAIKHNEQICSREQAIKDLVGEGRLVVLPLERYRYNSDFEKFCANINEIKDLFLRRCEFSASYSPAQRAKDSNVRRRESEYDASINAMLEKIKDNVVNAFNDIDAGIAKIFDGVEYLTGYHGVMK